MKDKLIKTGKKKPYYIMKAALLSLAFILLALIILSLPVGITYGIYLKSLSANPTMEAMKEGLSAIALGL